MLTRTIPTRPELFLTHASGHILEEDLARFIVVNLMPVVVEASDASAVGTYVETRVRQEGQIQLPRDESLIDQAESVEDLDRSVAFGVIPVKRADTGCDASVLVK